MNSLQIHPDGSRTGFAPGETLRGNVSWEMESAPEAAELSLIWNTQGKGTTDMEVVQSIPFSHPQARDTRPFVIQLPEAPYSFSGQLISLIWNLELNIKPGNHSNSLEITIAPGGKEVLLPRIQSESK